ncbi:pyridoxamine 5'-phosphate oxidase family protein [Microlunatus ginsengisoli]|uniref:Pyridoxamine 5'-phosphate oxidase n=1 Tax=Microlunatus ginsengisoli TaxID=363863 RepID=A0ABP6ZJ69_9ACTN
MIIDWQSAVPGVRPPSAPPTPAWPVELTGVFADTLACEYASLTGDGRPVTWAVTPYVGERTLDVSTGLSYPQKAERARRNPRIALLFSDLSGRTGDDTTVVLVEGLADVRDADLQANTDRYVRESLARGQGLQGQPWWVLKRMGWYFARIWVGLTPIRVTWWPDGRLDQGPRVWEPVVPPIAPPSDPRPAPTPAAVPASEPAPGPRRPGSSVVLHGGARRLGSGRQPGPSRAPVDWRPFADRAARLGTPVVTMVAHGGPLPLRAVSAERTEHGYRLVLPAGTDPLPGPVCLTFHRVGAGLAWQENVVLVGSGVPAGGSLDVVVERPLTDWSLPAGGAVQRIRAFTGPSRRLRRRLAIEAARRGQPVPTVRRVGG